MKYNIQIRKDLEDRNATALIERVVYNNKRWQYIIYKGKRYELFGGIRCPFFIILDKP